MAEVRPGWYHGKGDPEGTVRYWNGEEWVGDPVMAPEAQERPVATEPVSEGLPRYTGGAAANTGPIYDRPATRGSLLSRVVSPNGRINRGSMAAFIGIVIGVIMVLTIIDLVAGTYSEESGIGVLGGIGSLVLLWPQIAMAAKRFHDFNFSGWFAALTLIPFVNLGVLIWLIAHPGNPEPNRFGPPPPPGVRF